MSRKSKRIFTNLDIELAELAARQDARNPTKAEPVFLWLGQSKMITSARNESRTIETLVRGNVSAVLLETIDGKRHLFAQQSPQTARDIILHAEALERHFATFNLRNVTRSSLLILAPSGEPDWPGTSFKAWVSSSARMACPEIKTRAFSFDNPAAIPHKLEIELTADGLTVCRLGFGQFPL